MILDLLYFKCSIKSSKTLFTWQWLAPEVVNLSSPFYDERADIYCKTNAVLYPSLKCFLAYGITLFEIATREYPYASYSQFIEVKEVPLDEKNLQDKQFLQGSNLILFLLTFPFRSKKERLVD